MSSDKPVTERQLQEALVPYLTEKKFREVLQDYPTNQKMEEAMRKNTEEIVTEIRNVVQVFSESFTQLQAQITQIQANMVTKSYLDDKIADFRGQTVVWVKGSDEKTNALVHKLRKPVALSKKDADEVVEMSPFGRKE